MKKDEGHQMLSHSEYELILRRDLSSFVERAFYEINPGGKFVSGAYIDLLAAKLEKCRRGQTRRLIINLPPRTLKSHTASVSFTAWILGHTPAAQIICASYGQDLADKHARDTRRVMSSSFYRSLFPGTQLSSEKQSVNEFVTTSGGFRMATSVGGVLTGRGADFILLDDAMKPEEALSETRRKSVNEWFDNTLLSRLNNKETGCIIILMQRLHQDDLVGHVLEQGHWELVSLPAIAEADERFVFKTVFGQMVFERKVGEALHPERESVETLRNVEKDIGEYNFASQYQQSPLPVGGAMIKRIWLRYYQINQLPERFTFILQSWDTANKNGELNDFSVCTTWGCYNDHYYLLDVFRRRLNYPELRRAVAEQAQKYGGHTILIEDKASGTSLLQDLGRDGVLWVKPYDPPPGNDKIMRLFAQSAEFEKGRILLPCEAPWLAEYVRELTSFPGSKFDDQVDSTTQAIDYLKSNSSLEVWAKLGRT